jgi:hypothetical protein
LLHKAAHHLFSRSYHKLWHKLSQEASPKVTPNLHGWKPVYLHWDWQECIHQARWVSMSHRCKPTPRNIHYPHQNIRKASLLNSYTQLMRLVSRESSNLPVYLAEYRSERCYFWKAKENYRFPCSASIWGAWHWESEIDLEEG